MANDLPVSIFAGSLFAVRSNPALARKIAESGGWPLGEVTLRNFSDGEIYVRYEESIRGTDLFIVQSTPPPAEHWMELFLMIDAARRASAARITAVIPYFGYARQDRKDQPRVSIAARMIAKMLQDAGVDRVLTMDLHAAQIQGFFDIPVDHLYGSAVFEKLARREHPGRIGRRDGRRPSPARSATTWSSWHRTWAPRRSRAPTPSGSAPGSR